MSNTTVADILAERPVTKEKQDSVEQKGFKIKYPAMFSNSGLQEVL